MVQTGKGKGKGKIVRSMFRQQTDKDMAIAKPSTYSLKLVGGIAKEGTCFHCGQNGHWNWKCPKYLE